MGGTLVWAAPMLTGARLVAVTDGWSQDDELAGAVARFDTVELGCIHLTAAAIDGHLAPDAASAGALGRVEAVTQDGSRVEVSGTFGVLVLEGDTAVELLDVWTGDVDEERSLRTNPVLEQRVLGSILARPEVQVRISRRGAPERSDVVVTASGQLAAVHHDGRATLFVGADLSVRVAELAGLLCHQSPAGAAPDASDPTRALVVVQVVNTVEAGVLRGGTFAWLECGRSGWVVELEPGRRTPTTVRALVERIVSAIHGDVDAELADRERVGSVGG